MKGIRQHNVNEKLGVFFFLAFVSLASYGCMDPSQYEPEGPPVKADPPEGPTVLQPAQDVIFRIRYQELVHLAWTAVDGAQGYEYQVDTDPSFVGSFPYLTASTDTSYYAHSYPPITTYFFRVRAHSSAWIWYTDYSEPRRFHVMPIEDDTILH